MKEKKSSKNLIKGHRPSKDQSTERGWSFWQEALTLALLATAVLLIYSVAFQGPFVFDDKQNLEKNPHIRLTQLTPEGLARAGFESPCPNRPVANITFALNYYFHQDNVAGYHIVNVLIHIATGIFLYYFFKATLSLPSVRSRYEPFNPWLPLFAVFIWLVHPVQTQAVSYVVQRMTSLAAMFYVLALFSYVKGRLVKERGRRWSWFAGSVVAGLLALGSKEIAVTLPFVVFLYEWYFFQDLSPKWLKQCLPVMIGVLILFGCIAFFYAGSHPWQKILSGYAIREFTLPQRVLTEFRVMIFYISLLFFPHPSRLNLEHDFSISESLMDPVTTLFSLGLIAGLLGLAVWTAKKDRVLSFCILWFFGNLVIESSVIGLELVFEHRLYLPSMFVSLAAVSMAHRYVKTPWARAAGLCVVLVTFCAWTYQRNHVWSDSLSLCMDTVTKSPNKPRARYNLGVVLGKQDRLDEAVVHYLKALEIQPDYVDARNNLGAALVRQGRLEEAMRQYAAVLKVKPRYPKAYFNLGAVLTDLGKFEEATTYYARALELQPDYAEAHNNLGSALAKQGKSEEAMRHFVRAIEIQPDHGEAHANLGAVLVKRGRLDEAIGHFREALRLNPNDGTLYYGLGGVLAVKGMYDEAISHFSKGLQIQPTAKGHYNLGVMLAQQGKYEEAMGHFAKALEIAPDHADARYNLKALQEVLSRKRISTMPADE